MSDFDEEAERERLREQYEQEQRKREATEHMSDLLLKGATMTDAHCDACGDPIFRYDGQEFCPTCQQPVGAEDGASTDEQTDQQAQSAVDSTQAETDHPSSTEHSGPEAQPDAAGQPTGQGPADDQRPSAHASTGDRPANSGSEPDPGRVEVPTVDPTTGREQAERVSETPAGDLQTARQSLLRTLATFSKQAEATDDPRRARDALEAVSEAADALAALDQVR
ncbi:Sjogren's syndrome/scleroderma autoantigen 1 family protein [Halorhabdus sp. CUG00001]|uniref:Sjogren's syndrome/scleroderma autoantigen 1 family protein n=1 Tax=Halorhabdus sp. CUG00001 TaxID=2600297 RepID=UPI00131EAD12|nr:Sjogren's syndrome/scleroderma autoantigen 1 family protein [Halorhabdus sp. CUG00001]